jgi:hypothetical protein
MNDVGRAGRLLGKLKICCYFSVEEPHRTLCVKDLDPEEEYQNGQELYPTYEGVVQ